MAKLRIPQAVLAADCFDGITQDEAIALLFALAGRYRRAVLGGAPYERAVLPNLVGSGVSVQAPNLATGTQFEYIAYTLGGRLIRFRIQVLRNLTTDPFHDILQILSVSWSSNVVSRFAMTAMAFPERLRYATNDTLRTGTVSPLTLATGSNSPTFVLEGELIPTGMDVSTARGRHGELGLNANLDQELVVPDPNQFVAEINLYLAQRDRNGDIPESFINHVRSVLP